MSKITLRFLVVIFITNVFTFNAFANIPKGQKAYIKNCKVCHGNGIKGAAMHTQVEWEELFSNNGTKIKQAHQKDEKADAFFKTELFSIHYKDIRDFLLYSASDSDQ
ncbi:MAG: cytochrome c [Sulfuricurvum sp.]|uniref:c-type cytochrome n=1 Tax=Sulfuricurvum sp. TaxID=2025608 RepID=UPI00262645BA|nr:cytochrome c [Sulfuricurvum sp.]MDD2829410.1 cytochrome c [Sulfuricurvum sp.]MDD4948228.1 cytochrome c [Sulfuricurvum sp.]